MKKVFIIFLFITIILVLSGCGKKELTVERVVEIAQMLVESGSSQFVKDTIVNFDDPDTERIDKYGPDNKKAWKVTFNTTQDGLLGPMTMYFDRHTGEFLGADLRY